MSKLFLIGHIGFELYFNCLPHKPDPEKETFRKHRGKKEKMLVTSIFSFSHNVFYQYQKEFLCLSDIYFVVCKCFQLGPA